MSRTREEEAQQDPNQVVVQAQAVVVTTGQQHANETPVLYEERASAVAPVFTSRDLAEIISGTNNRGSIFTGRDLADIIGGNSNRESSSSAVFKSVDSFVSKFNSKDSYGIPFQSNDEEKVRSRRTRVDSIDTIASAELEDELRPQSPVARQSSSGFPCTNSGDTITVAPYAIGRETTAPSPTTMEMTMDALDVLSGKMKRPNPSGFNAMFASSDWQGNFRGEHIDVEYQGMFSSLDRQQAEAIKMLSDENPRVRANSTAETQDIPRTDWMREFNTIFNQSGQAQQQSLQQAFEPTRSPAKGPLHREPPPTLAPTVGDAAMLEAATYNEAQPYGGAPTYGDALPYAEAPTYGEPPTVEPQSVLKTDWMKEFNTIFTQVNNIPAQSAPAAHPPVPTFVATLPAADQASANNSTCTPATILEPKKKKVKKRRSQEPEVKEYVDNPTNDDVLLGRGGRSNHHSGNKRYRDEIVALQTLYRDASKDGKTEISQLLVDRVRSYGGRFLKLDESVHRWYLVKNIVARRKASQALRETNTPEVRQAKRERLSKKKTGSEQESMESS